MIADFDASSASIDRRNALALLVGAGVALKGGAPSAVQAQTTPRFTPAQVLNGAGARVFPTEIKSELKKLAPNVYAFIQSQPEGWSSFNISNCGVVVGADLLVAIDGSAAPLMAKSLLPMPIRRPESDLDERSLRMFTGITPTELNFWTSPT